MVSVSSKMNCSCLKDKEQSCCCSLVSFEWQRISKVGVAVCCQAQQTPLTSSVYIILWEHSFVNHWCNKWGTLSTSLKASWHLPRYQKGTQDNGTILQLMGKDLEVFVDPDFAANWDNHETQDRGTTILVDQDTDTWLTMPDAPYYGSHNYKTNVPWVPPRMSTQDYHMPSRDAITIMNMFLRRWKRQDFRSKRPKRECIAEYLKTTPERWRLPRCTSFTLGQNTWTVDYITFGHMLTVRRSFQSTRLIQGNNPQTFWPSHWTRKYCYYIARLWLDSNIKGCYGLIERGSVTISRFQRDSTSPEREGSNLSSLKGLREVEYLIHASANNESGWLEQLFLIDLPRAWCRDAFSGKPSCLSI
jgi:hypothetical protein